MKILVHDFSGHPFQVQLSRTLAKRGYSVLHVYSKSFETPKGSVQKKRSDPGNFNIIGISQNKSFPKYSLIQRWFAEKRYAKDLLNTANEFKPDIVISSNTPLDIQKHFYHYCKKMNIRFVFWVQDIYSIAIHDALKKKLLSIGELISLYYKYLEKYLLKNADHVVVISEDFKTIIQKWTNKTEIAVIENWAPIDEVQQQLKRNHWSIANGLDKQFCFLYSGTLGMKHNPNVLLQLAKQYRHCEDISIIIVSEGIGRKWLENQVKKEGLKNVRFFNYFDFGIFPFVASSADVLIAILEDKAGIYSVPSKVLTYHCIGRPLLLSVPRENLASKIVNHNRSGIVCDSNDIYDFCQSADKLKKNRDLRIRMGNNAKKYAKSAFNVDKKCDSFIQIFR